MSSAFITSFAVTGHPHIQNLHAPFSVFDPQFDRLLKAVAAAGNNYPAP
jgi:hypothetical protein